MVCGFLRLDQFVSKSFEVSRAARAPLGLIGTASDFYSDEGGLVSRRGCGAGMGGAGRDGVCSGSAWLVLARVDLI